MTQKSEENNENKLACIPKKLEVKTRPELSVFPLNVLFASIHSEGGKMIKGHALYEPDLASYQKNGDTETMRYKNAHGGNHWLEIKYNKKDGYEGKKFINGKLETISFGKDWKNFFMHFTILGLGDNESCAFD